MPRRVICLLVLGLSCGTFVRAQEATVFSGPQPGEKLGQFTARGVFDDLAGKDTDVVARAEGKALLLVFVHDPLTRPSAAVARGLAEYAAKNTAKIDHATIWLNDDRSEAEAYLRRARSSLNLPGTVLVSLDGADGPGVLGLNREVSLTILVARDGMVTGNFALVQPSTTDGPKIVASIAETAGTRAVTQNEFDQLCYGENRAMMRRDGAEIPRPLLAAVINKQATAEQVAEAIEKVEEYVRDNPARQKTLGQIARRIVENGKLSNYGTQPAQEQLRKWAAQYKTSDQPNDSTETPQDKPDREAN